MKLFKEAQDKFLTSRGLPTELTGWKEIKEGFIYDVKFFNAAQVVMLCFFLYMAVIALWVAFQ